MQHDTTFRYHGQHVDHHMDDQASHDTGVKGTTILYQLTSVDFPRSFVIDLMHLFYANLIPTSFDHFRGKFFATEKPKPNANQTQAGRPPDSVYKSARFVQTDDPYCVPPKHWTQIGADMRSSAPTFPEAFGPAIRDITDSCATYKAVEWQNWAYISSPIMLYKVLPPDFHQVQTDPGVNTLMTITYKMSITRHTWD